MAKEVILMGANVFAISITACKYIVTVRSLAGNVSLGRVSEPHHHWTNEFHGPTYAPEVDAATWAIDECLIINAKSTSTRSS
jgi:hypothetical protein